MSSQRVLLNRSLWICGGFVEGANRHARAEMAALRERGAEVFVLKSHDDLEGLEKLRRLLWQSDAHAILMWLHPRELAALRPIFRERKNFSAVLDDWWIIPHWFVREAEYKIFRKYNGIAIRLGQSKFVCDPPPWLVGRVPFSPYSLFAKTFRLPALAVSPMVDAYRQWQRSREKIEPKKMLLFPFTAVADAIPLKTERIQYDFGVTGSTCGVWVMRDPFVPFRYTFANLYYDRERLMDCIVRFEGQPFKTYDWRRVTGSMPPQAWEEYLKITRECRYVVSSGGLHEAAVPKYMEYACSGTPMIGRKLPFEYPWLDDCLFEVDIMRLSAEQLKPLLHEAIERYPVMRENCLKWRDRIFEHYETHRLLDVVQMQMDGAPVPPEYLTEKGKECEKIRTGGQKVISS